MTTADDAGAAVAVADGVGLIVAEGVGTTVVAMATDVMNEARMHVTNICMQSFCVI